MQARGGRNDVAAEDILLFLQRHAHHVVERQEGPDDQDSAEDNDRRLHHPSVQAGTTGKVHSCTWPFFSWRINRMTNGISTGRADNTVAMPNGGLPISNALRMPSVARTWVESAGPPPEMKRTALKSPSAHMAL